MKLTRKNIIKCGFFPDNMPTKVFTSKEIAQYIESDPANYIKILNKRKSTPCLFISSYKNDMERRIIAVPHIETYTVLCSEIESINHYIDKIFLSNENSYSNTIQPSSIEGYDIKSRFFKNYIDRTIFSTGYKYMLKLDLSKCYENIYTHSIAWAICGKEKSKQEVLKKPKNRDPLFKQVDKLDEYVRSINNNETKGIPTGPLTSRIVSEIILSSIDEELRNKNYHFKRYVDDYNFYFRNEVEIYEFLPKFQNLLYEYKLHINTEKTSIEKYPYQLKQDFTDELRNHDFKKKGYLKYLEKAIEYHNQGHKGALKYALKVIGKKKIPDNEKEVVFSHVINIMLTFPNLSEFIHVLMLNNNFTFNDETEETVNSILEHCIINKYEIESIWLLTIMGCLNMTINEEILCKILNNNEPLTAILSLDYIFNYKLYNQDKIKKAINNLKTVLKTQSIYGEKWLLLYEVNKNKWITGLRKNLNDSPFLKEACDNDICFFKSPII